MSIAATKISSYLIFVIGRKLSILCPPKSCQSFKLSCTTKANLPPLVNTKTNMSALTSAQSTTVLAPKDLLQKATRCGTSVFTKCLIAELVPKAAPTPYFFAMSQIAHVDLGLGILGLIVETT